MTREDFDVVVVGGGPAGTAAAIDLRRGGATVLLLERRTSGAGKACAGALTTKAVRRLRFDLGQVARREETAVELRHRGRRVGRVVAEAPMAVTTVRAEFDALCLREAAQQGAEIRREAAAAAKERPGGVMVRTSGGTEVRSRFVVAADGASSRVRRSLGGPPSRQAVAVEGCVPASAMPPLDHLMFDVAGTSGGYAWAFSKGDHVNIGLYSPGGAALSKADLAGYARHVLDVESLCGVIGHALGVGGPRPWPGTGRILLAGDAAGAAERLLGEGIHNAIASGQSAAAAILGALGTDGDAAAAHASGMRDVADDVALCDRLASLFYRWPRLGCAALAVPKLSTGLARGFAAGEPLRKIVDARISSNRVTAMVAGALDLKRPSAGEEAR